MLDQLSPVAPARVRVVLLPTGQIRRVRFSTFVERLQLENAVRLGDISPDGRPHRNMFSPLAFPTGTIVYDFTTFYPPPSHVALSPFELYREPLVIIALADGAELDHISYQGNARRSVNGNGPTSPNNNLRDLYQDLEDLRDKYPKALVHQMLLFDYVHRRSGTLPEGLVAVPPLEDCKRTTMKTIMCDISSMLLAEMTTLAKSLQALNTIESPTQAQVSRQHNGGPWPTGHEDWTSRRNSEYSAPGSDSRPNSPKAIADRSHVRMSMPAQLRSFGSNTSSPSARPSTPTNGVPATFDEIVGPTAGEIGAHRNTSGRFVAADAVRDTSRDRVSVQGFGSGSVSERSRNRGKGRIGMVIGSLYLKAGRWPDALKELAEAATTSKNNLDHLWHAKALDNILAGMLMLAWAGLDFQIPQICYTSAEKIPSAPVSGDRNVLASNRLISLQNLTGLLPELLDRILGLYARAANNTAESLPQLSFSESVLRFSKLESALHLAGGVIENDVLQHLVLGKLLKSPNLLTPRLNIRPTRTEIVTMLFRAFPSKSASPESLSLVDRILILSGIASVLGSLGFNRKKAMVIRELVSVLIPGLVQARIKGAAEMGVHPAAGLAALTSVNGSAKGAGALDLGEGDGESGVDAFLGLLVQTYGVVSVTSSSDQDEPFDDSNDATIARIVENASVRAFGGPNLKMDVLQACISLSEALPDFHGVLRFTADLLRTAGSGVAPGPRSVDASPSMIREEQFRLASNISKTLSAARNLGVRDMAAEYWDEFLVRGVELDALAATRTPIPHRRSEIPGAAAIAASRETNPFIYNPFLKSTNTSAVAHLLVAGEAAVFKVILQNPYEFEVEIESIKLETEGVDFETAIQKTVVGPYRSQILGVSGIPKVSGQLKITGCMIRVRGCRERRFPIFEEPWSPQRATKIKAIGVAAIFKAKNRPASVGSGPLATTPVMTPPKVASLALAVIDRQPVVVVSSASLSQYALMVLEGERQVFSIALQNLSNDTPVDLLLFSFKDSTQVPLQTAMSNRDASPADLYEYELILAQKQALRLIQKPGEKPYIAPGSTAIFQFEVLGRPGLTNAVVHIDYAHLGGSEDQEQFHTRQVSVPITVTVNASIELARMNVLPLTAGIPCSPWIPHSSEDGAPRLLSREDYCLLVLDLRNAWPCSLQVCLEASNSGTVEEEILPGNTSRVMFPIRRIFLDDPTASIPSLDPSRQRQFVVSAGRLSADTERSSRETFWYREEILKMLRGSWTTKSGPHRKGEIELRGIRPSPRMIEAVKVDDIGLELAINGVVVRNEKYQISTDKFYEIKASIMNRMKEPIFPLLRIQPSVRNQPHNMSLDLSKKLIWNGVLQQTLPILQGRESVEVSIGVTALCRGEFEINASVEEARLEPSPEKGIKEEGKRPRANTRQMMDAVLGARERRIWHSREPCLLVVRDEESDDDGEGDGDRDGDG